jgi:hypothetical protein
MAIVIACLVSNERRRESLRKITDELEKKGADVFWICGDLPAQERTGIPPYKCFHTNSNCESQYVCSDIFLAVYIDSQVIDKEMFRLLCSSNVKYIDIYECDFAPEDCRLPYDLKYLFIDDRTDRDIVALLGALENSRIEYLDIFTSDGFSDIQISQLNRLDHLRVLQLMSYPVDRYKSEGDFNIELDKTELRRFTFLPKLQKANIPLQVEKILTSDTYARKGGS